MKSKKSYIWLIFIILLVVSFLYYLFYIRGNSEQNDTIVIVDGIVKKDTTGGGGGGLSDIINDIIYDNNNLMNVKYYDENKNEITVGQQSFIGETRVYYISFSINVKNTGNIFLDNVSITGVSPEPFERAIQDMFLPFPYYLYNTTLLPGEEVTWESDLIELKPLESYAQPIHFMLEITAYSSRDGQRLINRGHVYIEIKGCPVGISSSDGSCTATLWKQYGLQDAELLRAQPTSEWGKGDVIRLGEYYDGILEFNISFMPEDAIVESATLRLPFYHKDPPPPYYDFIINVTNYLVYDSFRVDGLRWTEGINENTPFITIIPGVITWNKRPQVGSYGIPGETKIFGKLNSWIWDTTETTWIEFDSTNMLQYAQSNHYKTISIYLAANGGPYQKDVDDFLGIQTKDAGNHPDVYTMQPQLIIDYIVPE